MSPFSNKHVILALIMAPILAIIAWFAVGAWTGEEPSEAVAGHSYKLVEKPNCRYESGMCGLKNGDFEILVTPERKTDGGFSLVLNSKFALEGVKLAFTGSEINETHPLSMQAIDADGMTWALDVDEPDPQRDRMRLVVSADGSLYFGDTALTFLAQQDDTP